MLGSAYVSHEAELRADFQQFYGLCIDEIGDTFSISHAASLCEQLPRNSRLMMIIDPLNSWNDQMWLLAHMEFSLRILRGAGVNGETVSMITPRSLYEPVQVPKTNVEEERLSIDEVKDILNRRRHG